MNRLALTIAGLLAATAAAAAIAAISSIRPTLGQALLVAAGVGLAAYLLREDLARLLDLARTSLGRPVGRLGLATLGAWIVTAPAVLSYDPAAFAPRREGHIDRNPLDFYLLASDDVAYVAASRTWDRTVANLMMPHNTHIVPAWRLVTWALVAGAGDLGGLPRVLAVASYGILVAVMLMAGRLVARETGRVLPGLSASAMVGTTSLMLTPSMWYSGGQPLWAALGILAALWHAQSYRRGGGWPHLAMSAVAAAVAGGLWSAGHLAGPSAALYLRLDGRRRCRRAAAVPLAATAATVALLLALAARPIDSRLSLQGRTLGEAADPVQGLITTAQAIPANLILANLGLDARATPSQGLILTLGLLGSWAWTRLRRAPATVHGPEAPSPPSSRPSSALNPMECAGAAIVLGCYLIVWTFRGSYEYHNLRTISPYAIVPWYDAIPQVGAVLFAVGWWSGPHRPPARDPRAAGRGRPAPTRVAAAGLALMVLVLVLLNRPRVDALIRGTAPPLTDSEREFFKTPRLLTMRAGTLMSFRVAWQRRYLHRLDQAEVIARRLGIGQDGLRAAFGFVLIPASTGRLLLLHRDLYDVAAILDLPPHGRASDPAAIRAAMGPYLRPEPEPRPPWIMPDEVWPPE